MGEESGGEAGGGWRSRVLGGDRTFGCTASRYAQPRALCRCLFLPGCRTETRQPSPSVFGSWQSGGVSVLSHRRRPFRFVVRVKLTRLCCNDTLQSLRFVNLVLSALKEKQTVSPLIASFFNLLDPFKLQPFFFFPISHRN